MLKNTSANDLQHFLGGPLLLKDSVNHDFRIAQKAKFLLVAVWLKTLDDGESRFDIFAADIDTDNVDTLCRLPEDSLAGKRPTINVVAKSRHLSFTMRNRFLLCVGLESHQFAVTILLNDRQRDKQVCRVGNAPRGVSENKTRQNQRRFRYGHNALG